ncbi:MAG TPA: TetR family transcriptional regulator [Pseudonocardia sp.]|uniref:TetR family transcriptional regulator n=1 Tax=Pseudonocardia sp. TaxID=60912 RepID=UPI002BCC89A8|nr:TetR family transcriptional regulator [Pseudonocardia sp.]HTF49890.1 TetR family transcriptional regulator [Pseudonocardia sp.]
MTAQPAVREEPPHGAVGHAVRLSRLAAGMSLRELARRIKVSAATVHAIETGKTDLAVSRLRDIATVLHTTPERLLTTDASIDVEPAAPRRRPTVAPPVGIEDWRMFGPLRIDPVLAAAITVFVRTGYHGATMRSIARRAGMSVPGVYHHYRGKQMLLVTTLDLSMDDLTWRVLAAGAEGRDGISRVRLMVEALALFHTHRWELAFIGASEMRSLEPADRRRIADLRNHVQHLLDEAIDQAIAEGSLGTPSPRHAGRAIATMCTSLPQWFHLGGPTSPEQIAAEYARFALGLLAHPLAAPA